eukprot:1158125-Pelagomonas_calceolata.AAC.3
MLTHTCLGGIGDFVRQGSWQGQGRFARMGRQLGPAFNFCLSSDQRALNVLNFDCCSTFVAVCLSSAGLFWQT